MYLLNIFLKLFLEFWFEFFILKNHSTYVYIIVSKVPLNLGEGYLKLSIFILYNPSYYCEISYYIIVCGLMARTYIIIYYNISTYDYNTIYNICNKLFLYTQHFRLHNNYYNIPTIEVKGIDNNL